MAVAGSGDAFVVNVTSPAGDPWLAVIDGGPSGTPSNSLLALLDHLDAGKRGIDLFAITHVDSDHIGGAIDILSGIQGGVLAYTVRNAWHNSFESITHDQRISREAGLRTATLSFADSLEVAASEEAVAVVASIAQGVTLADLLADLDLGGNPPFGALLTQGMIATWGDDLTIDVLGPTEEEIERLRTRWEQYVNDQGDGITAAALAASEIDQSVTNLSSVIMLLEHGTTRALFTGDARGDQIVAGLAAQDRLSSGTIELDAFKLPHHGSERSCTSEMFEAVVADHYLISGNGSHGNPSPITANRLIAALHGRAATVWMTHDVAGVADVLSAAPNITLYLPADDSPGVRLAL